MRLGGFSKDIRKPNVYYNYVYLTHHNYKKLYHVNISAEKCVVTFNQQIVRNCPKSRDKIQT